MFAKKQKLFSLNFLLIVMLISGVLGVTPAKASQKALITPTSSPTPPSSYQPLYISLLSGQTIGGVASSNEDILRFDGQTWSLFFDGSDVGMGSPNLFAFSLLDADTILMSFNANVTVSGLSITPRDVVRFDATSLGSVTAGSFSMYLNGIDVGLDTSSENIDGLDILPDGRVLISTTGTPSVPEGTEVRDEDILAFTPTALGNNTSGSWARYLDGSSVGLGDSSDEDIDALDVVLDGSIYLSTTGTFVIVPGLTGEDEDVFICKFPTGSSCSFPSTPYFDGGTWGLAANDVDAVHVLESGPTPTPSITATQTPTNTPTQTPSATPTGTFCPQPTPEPLQVEPVISPTNHSFQAITVRIGNGDSVTVTSESGIYTVTGNFSTANPAIVNLPLLSNTTHHLNVSAHVRPITGPGGCTYGNYTLSTTVDRFGAPLTIVQQTGTVTPSATPGGNILTLSPIADTYVNATNPGSNYGTAILLRTDASPDLHSYLRFQVQGLTSPITKATLRLFSGNTSSIGYQIRSVSNNTWMEGTLNYNNAPAVGTLIGSSGAITANTWSTVDLTSFITGNGVFNLALTSTNTSAYSFPSRESGYGRPELVLETQAGPISTATFTPSPTNPPTLTPSLTSTNPAGSSPTPTDTQTTSSSVYTFDSIGDSYVDANNPATNYGTQVALRVDASPVIRSYLRFNLQGISGNVTRATLRVFSKSASSVGCTLSQVSDNTWSESTINYNNAPPPGSALGSSGSFGAGVWITMDVTGYISGNGVYDLALTTPGSTAISFASRESGANAPQLIIETQ